MEGVPFQNLKLTCIQKVIPFEPMASRKLAHRDLQEGFETVQGTVLAAFEGATHGANYLDLKTGDQILVFPESTTEGWVLAKKGQDDGVEIGWIPSNYYELANTTSSSCFFNSGDLVPGMAAEELEEKGDPAQQHEASRAGTCGSASCMLSNNHESGHACRAPKSLVCLAEELKDGMNFVVKKVWFNLNTSTGYFGIYWFCTTASSHFRLHCTIAKWDVRKWVTTGIFNWEERVDFNKLKAEFDEWVRDPSISARLLCWEALDVYNLVEKQRDYDHSQWRIIMNLRDSVHKKKLYEIRKEFENIYELKDCNDAGKIHYSLDQQT